MEWLLLWLFMVSPQIASGLSMLGGAMLFAFGGHFFFNFINNIDSGGEKPWKSLKKTLVFGLLALALASIIPSKKDIALIVAGGVSYNVITSDEAKEIGGKTLKLLNENIDSYMKDAGEGVKEAVKETTKAGIAEAKDTIKPAK